MTRDELIKTAVKTVIQYAEEQGVKLRRIDFKESKWIFVPDGAINYAEGEIEGKRALNAQYIEE